MNNRFLWAKIALANYLVMFLILPHTLLVWAGEVLCFTGVAVWVIFAGIYFTLKSARPRQFLLQIILFYPLVMLYHPRGIYGIFTGSTLDMSPAWLDALEFIALIAIGQALLSAAVRWVRRKKA